MSDDVSPSLPRRQLLEICGSVDLLAELLAAQERGSDVAEGIEAITQGLKQRLGHSVAGDGGSIHQLLEHLRGQVAAILQEPHQNRPDHRQPLTQLAADLRQAIDAVPKWPLLEAIEYPEFPVRFAEQPRDPDLSSRGEDVRPPTLPPPATAQASPESEHEKAARAAALILHEPLTIGEIADRVGVYREWLYRNPVTKEAIRLRKAAKRGLPKGAKGRDGSIEAWGEREE